MAELGKELNRDIFCRSVTFQRRVLLIDDDPDSREIYRQMLEWGGFQVETAPNGAAGVRAATARAPHAVLVDLDMPGLNGMEVLRQLRADPRTMRVPVAALTGAPEMLDTVSDARFDAVVVKPAIGDEILIPVRRLVMGAES